MGQPNRGFFQPFGKVPFEKTCFFSLQNAPKNHPGNKSHARTRKTEEKSSVVEAAAAAAALAGRADRWDKIFTAEPAK
jgi:hypothetical protein